MNATWIGTIFGLVCAFTGHWMLGLGCAAGMLLYVLISTGIAGPLLKGVGKVVLCLVGPTLVFGLMLAIYVAAKG
jgi:hypothetical protein